MVEATVFAPEEAAHHAEAMRRAHLTGLLKQFLNTPLEDRPRYKQIVSRDYYAELTRMAEDASG